MQDRKQEDNEGRRQADRREVVQETGEEGGEETSRQERGRTGDR